MDDWGDPMVKQRKDVLSEKHWNRPLLTISVVFLLMVGALASINLYVGHKALLAPGPNTLGEAGKAYYAQQFRSGESLFGTGKTAPYYPSFHGALLHGSVGFLGRISGSSITGLYYIGRGISVISTIIALILCGLLLQRWGTSWWWMLPLLLLFFAVQRVTQHTYSYRPDNWILMLSVLSCYLIITQAGRRWAIGFLSVIPVLAFYIKATGIVLLPMIVIAMASQKRWRDTMVCLIVGSALILVSVLGINAMSGGAFLEAMRNGASVGYSPILIFKCLKVPLMWVPLFAPVVLLNRISWSQAGPSGDRAIVWVFWSISLVWMCLATTRLGANSYYFIEAFTFGLVLTVNWVADEIKPAIRQASGVPNTALPVLLLLISLQASPDLLHKIIRIVEQGRPPYDFALTDTMKFHQDRRLIVNQVRRLSTQKDRYEWLCLSDDPGLNVMLDQPAMVHPLVTHLMMRNGTIDANQLVHAIEQGRVAMIVLIGEVRSYAGINRMPDAIVEAIQKHYHRVRTDTQYMVLKPKPG